MAQVNKFMVAKVKAEVLEGIFNQLEFDLKNVTKHYGKTGNMIQSTHWDSSRHEFVADWEDEEQTIPKMVEEWDDVEYTEEELDNMPEILAKQEVIKMIMTKLENMI